MAAQGQLKHSRQSSLGMERLLPAAIPSSSLPTTGQHQHQLQSTLCGTRGRAGERGHVTVGDTL